MAHLPYYTDVLYGLGADICHLVQQGLVRDIVVWWMITNRNYYFTPLKDGKAIY